MVAGDLALASQEFEISPNGHFGDFQALSQLGHGGETPLPDAFKDLFAALVQICGASTLFDHSR